MIILSLTALVVSVCALGLSIWEGFETRKNYRLSVIPFIEIDGRFASDLDKVGIILINRGIGPAIIVDIEIIYKDQKYNYLSEPLKFISEFSNNLLQFDIDDFGYNFLGPSTYISVDQELPIIFLNKSEYHHVSKFRKSFYETSITVRYKSVYGDSFSKHFEMKKEDFLTSTDLLENYLAHMD